MAGLVTVINTFTPIRRFLPIEANLAHIQAVKQARAMVTECARQRMQDVDTAMDKGEKFDSIGLGNGGRDLLTLVVEERRRLKGSEDELAVEEVVDHVISTRPWMIPNRANKQLPRSSPLSLQAMRRALEFWYGRAIS